VMQPSHSCSNLRKLLVSISEVVEASQAFLTQSVLHHVPQHQLLLEVAHETGNA
jgi:Tat protein secretion system quality control protein TatD with DNase activity